MRAIAAPHLAGLAVTLVAHGVPFRCAIRERDDVLAVLATYEVGDAIVESDSFGTCVRGLTAASVEDYAMALAEALMECARPRSVRVVVERTAQCGVRLRVEATR